MHSKSFSLCGVGHQVHAGTAALPKATKTSVKMGGALAETQTRYLPNTCQLLFQPTHWYHFFLRCAS